jgi:hypothetical protein
MALTYRILKVRKRVTGYDAVVEVLDGTKVIEGVTPEFKSEPTEKDIATVMVPILARVETRLSESAIEPMRQYTEDEVVNLLIEQGYLEKGQKLTDLKASSSLMETK